MGQLGYADGKMFVESHMLLHQLVKGFLGEQIACRVLIGLDAECRAGSLDERSGPAEIPVSRILGAALSGVDGIPIEVEVRKCSSILR